MCRELEAWTLPDLFLKPLKTSNLELRHLKMSFTWKECEVLITKYKFELF